MNTKLQQEIKDIIDGIGHYGHVGIEQKQITHHVIWIGTNGYTASIGQWIRVVEKARKIWPITATYRWFCHTDEEPKHKDSMWYYGVRFERPLGFLDVLCGGATDFSGEGGHGKQLAEEYLSMISNREPLTLNADYLITMLTGGTE